MDKKDNNLIVFAIELVGGSVAALMFVKFVLLPLIEWAVTA